MPSAMSVLLFTKLFGSRPAGEIAPVAADLGFDGIDLLIRPGCTLAPDTVTDLPRVVEEFGSHGVPVSMVTTDLTDPDVYPVEAVLGACADAGISLVRLGYWSYDGSAPYLAVREQADRDLDRLAEHAEHFGVRLAIQLHGGTIHSSGGLTRTLLERHDPSLVAAYPDPGNQAVQDGREDWRLTFDLLEPWMACVGVKNGGWFVDVDKGWRSEWLGLSDGMVPWRDIAGWLHAHAFEGPLTLHSHYERPYDQVLAQTRSDLEYVRSVLAEAR